MTERSRGGTLSLPLLCSAGLGTNCKVEVVKPALETVLDFMLLIDELTGFVDRAPSVGDTP
jgi:hypothetical protein